MRRRLLSLALLGVVGCGGEAPTAAAPDPFGASPPPMSSVDVDTPQLRALKAEAGIATCPPTDDAPEVAGGLPEITLPCLGGGPDVRLAGLAGQPMVVNLWASWCAPCREELPILQEYAEQADGRVLVLGIDFQDTRPAAALELAERAGVTYPLVADTDASLKQPLRVGGLPWTVIVGPDGRIVQTVVGQIHSVDQLDQAVEEAAGVGIGG